MKSPGGVVSCALATILLSPAISVTDSLGFARTRWTLGCTAGEQTATAVTSAALEPVVFTATAIAPPDTARLAWSRVARHAGPRQ